MKAVKVTLVSISALGITTRFPSQRCKTTLGEHLVFFADVLGPSFGHTVWRQAATVVRVH